MINDIFEGIYNLEVRAYDPNDNFCSATIVVTVLEPDVIPTVTTTTTTPPVGMDPIVTLTIGVALGGGMALVIIVIVLKRSTGK